jgi:two-component system CheB/CheR fusion protein
VLVFRDITDRTVRRLQDEFLTLAGHELNTPLTIISGFLQLLDKELTAAPHSGRAHHRLQIVRKEAGRLQRLIDDLLDVARLQEGVLGVARQPLDLTAVVRHAVEAGQGLGGEWPVRLTAEPAPLWMVGDADRLEQVILNLLSNARLHAPEAAIDVLLRRVGHTAELVVQDNGPGIPAALVPQLFTRFAQATQVTKGRRWGLGLGLFIAREIVLAHGGQIAVRSVLGEGTTFTVTLPLQDERSGD